MGKLADDEVKRDAFWRLYTEHCTHMRHHEAQRSTVAASMIAVASALLGVVTFDKSLSLSDVPLLGLVFVLGTFGAVFSAKQYERSAMHMERARAYRDAIDEDLSGQPLKTLKAAADKRHNAEFPRLHRLRVNQFWLGLYLFVATTGFSLTVIAIFWPIAAAESTDSIGKSKPENLSEHEFRIPIAPEKKRNPGSPPKNTWLP